MPALFLYISSIILSLIILNENFTSVYNTEVFYYNFNFLLLTCIYGAGAVVLQKILRGKMLWNTVTRPISIIINQFNNINFMGIDGRACPPKFEERRRARKFSSGEDISGCPPIYSHKAVMLSVTKHLGFMRFFTSFRMTANLLSVTCPTAAQWRVGHRLLVGYRLLARQCISYGSVIVHRLSVTCPTAAQWRVGYRLLVIRAGADVLQKFFGGRYLTTPTRPISIRNDVMLSVSEASRFMRFFTSFRMTANLLSVIRAGADVLQKFFGGRYLTTPTCPVVDSKKKDDGDKLIKNWN